MVCKSLAVPTDVEIILLSHVGGHSRVVNTAYGFGEKITKITLEGGLAQGANSSPALFIFTTAPAHRYADENLPGYFMPCAHSQHSPNISSKSPEDDDAGLNGREATTKVEVEHILNETKFAGSLY